MFLESWVLDWFAILNVATLVLAGLGLLFDPKAPKDRA